MTITHKNTDRRHKVDYDGRKDKDVVPFHPAKVITKCGLVLWPTEVRDTRRDDLPCLRCNS